MPEMSLTRINELIIIIYAFSVLFFFIDFIHNNRKANKIAFWLLSIVWLLQTIFLFYQMFTTGRFPILNISEGLYFYSWVLVTLSVVLNRFLRVDFIIFFTNVLGFIMLSIHTFAPSQYESAAVSGQLISELLFIHITMAILSYGAFTLSFVFSLLYLIQFNLLKKKKWGKQLLRIDDLAKLDHMSYVLNVIGVPMLLLSLILGVIWAYLKLPNFHWYDAKVLGSFMMLLVYSFYLYSRIVKEWQGKQVAYLNAASFLILLINFFLFGSLSRFHIWDS
ncbi:cytochrome c biogenesis protein [Metabacillus idriensis]|jgi:HemX protein|uniref:Cytochrome C assembly protein n=1 Tax=Metabacillus idriensis TaxID=324768 RepID=A0A6I2MI10_9BACI|nr:MULTISPECIES: cytochrome c biogenesis protein CcsA [Bacillaceae]OHR68329.1 cytochrome C assembly protein [Bacillus sp. HMSC76G11]MCM3596423.1 cytochrome c biogenesis protein [Metabacillus idriensis]MDQ0858192.1 HemX protein [Bacillus sp. V2I10]MDR0138169.1 cytochrome c biogenesis protein CcsA [Metabacillus idriensis]MRX56994.1 cytochrome C assembly protein [Metabacillus idriensis]